MISVPYILYVVEFKFLVMYYFLFEVNTGKQNRSQVIESIDVVVPQRQRTQKYIMCVFCEVFFVSVSIRCQSGKTASAVLEDATLIVKVSETCSRATITTKRNRSVVRSFNMSSLSAVPSSRTTRSVAFRIPMAMQKVTQLYLRCYFIIT